MTMPKYLFDLSHLDENEQATLFALSSLNRLSASEKLLVTSITKIKKGQKDFSLVLMEGLGCKIVLTRRGGLFRVAAQGVQMKHGHYNHVNVGESVKSIPGACARLYHHLETFALANARSLQRSLKMMVEHTKWDHTKCIPKWWECWGKLFGKGKARTIHTEDLGSVGMFKIERQLDTKFYTCFILHFEHEAVIHSDIKELLGKRSLGTSVWLERTGIKHDPTDAKRKINSRLAHLLFEL